MSKAKGLLGLIAANILVFALMLVVVEGLASFALLIRDMMLTRPVPERRHTKYDPELGWVSEPSLHIPDMYKPGAYLRTNKQGFRNDHDFDPAVPEGKLRVICSGDSFTLGHGVANNQTWCQLLESIEPRLETVNMGQGGYGVDQAYLWYKRDGTRLEHQVHIFTFITGDFGRMQSDNFLGYGKPVLAEEDGKLLLKNVPVPKRAYSVPWPLIRNDQNLNRLRMVELLHRVGGKVAMSPDRTRDVLKEQNDERTRKVLALLFRDLQRLNEERSRILAFVYLPTPAELKGNGPREWMQFIRAESQTLNIPFVDLFSAFRALPPGELEDKFEGHLSVQGNELVAMLIYKELFKEHPAIFRMLAIAKGASRISAQEGIRKDRLRR